MSMLRDLTARCAGIGAVLLPSIPTAACEPAPYLGVLIGARNADRVDAAELLIRAQGRELGRMFSSAGRTV
jgi:hypothetical protein